MLQYESPRNDASEFIRVTTLRANRRHIPRHILQNLSDNMVGCDPLGLCFEIQNQPMPHCGRRGCFNVIKAYVEPALGKRADLPGEDQRLTPARTAAEAQILRRNWCRRFGPGMRRQDQANGIVLYVRGYRHFAHQSH